MITSLYAGILALLIVWLSFNVIKIRRAEKISLGDGGNKKLQIAIRTHANSLEYVPIGLILLALVELAGIHYLFIHLAGMCIVVGRFLHAKGLLTENLAYRVFGMQFTLVAIIGLAIVNIGWGVYKNFF